MEGRIHDSRTKLCLWNGKIQYKKRFRRGLVKCKERKRRSAGTLSTQASWYEYIRPSTPSGSTAGPDEGDIHATAFYTIPQGGRRERTVYDTAQRDITTAGPGDEGHSASASVRLVAPHASAGAAPSRPRAAGYVVS